MAYKILVAEDDRSLNQGIRLALQREEFVFDMAYTLKETQEKWQKENPDMVILDVNFPDGNGFDFLRMLRQSSNIPVLVVTAMIWKQMRSQALPLVQMIILQSLSVLWHCV